MSRPSSVPDKSRDNLLFFKKGSAEATIEGNVDSFDSEKEAAFSLPNMSKDQEFFEFFYDLKAEMCAAEDIIFSGRLLPYKDPSLFNNFGTRNDWKLHKVSSSNSRMTLTPVIRISEKRGFIYDSFSVRKASSISSQLVSSSSSSSNSSSSSSQMKPKWSMFAFGLMKVSSDVDMIDIRKRSRRRKSLAAGGKETASVKSREVRGKKRSWKLLSTLSCHAHADVVVPSSFVPPV